MQIKLIVLARRFASTLCALSALVGCASEAHDSVRASSSSLVALDICAHFTAANGELITEVPTLLAPTGELSSDVATVVFTPVANADTYEIWVDRNGQNDFLESVSAAFVGCANGEPSCSIEISSGAGRSTAWVRARSTLCAGDWSSATNYEFHSDARVTVVAPSGNVASGTITYRWAAVDGATEYTVFVEDSRKSPFIVDTITSAQAGCVGGGSCRFVSTTAHPDGDYRFWVQSDLNTHWSDAMDFNVGELHQVALVSPSGAVPSLDVPFTFLPVPGSGHTYRVWIDDSPDGGPFLNQVFTDEEAGCVDGQGICSVGPFEGLTGSDSRFWVQVDDGEWTPAMDFSLAN